MRKKLKVDRSDKSKTRLTLPREELAIMNEMSRRKVRFLPIQVVKRIIKDIPPYEVEM